MSKPKPKGADVMALLRGRKADGGDEPGTVTAPELQEAMGCGYQTAKATAEALVREGKLTRAMVRRNTGWGVVQPVKGYRILG